MIDLIAILITSSIGIFAAFAAIETHHAKQQRRERQRVEQHVRDSYPRVY
jgi:hypothetical protein